VVGERNLSGKIMTSLPLRVQPTVCLPGRDGGSGCSGQEYGNGVEREIHVYELEA